MSGRILGALLIFAGCGGCGFAAASAARRELRSLQEFSRAAAFMACELRYRLTPLPELCRRASALCSGAVREVLRNLARELDWQDYPDAEGCMAEALRKAKPLPGSLRPLFSELGATLGRLDLEGQLRELDYVRASCEAALAQCAADRKERIRGYQTLGLCTGAALAVLLL